MPEITDIIFWMTEERNFSIPSSLINWFLKSEYLLIFSKYHNFFSELLSLNDSSRKHLQVEGPSYQAQI